MSPPANATFRGYANAVAVGILLAAAIKFIPITLTEIEFLGAGLISGYLSQPANSGPGAALWPVLFQTVVQSFSVVLVLLLFLYGNASKADKAPERLSVPDKSLNLPTRWRTWLALPVEDQMDRAGIFVVAGGLFCYNLWLGANQTPLNLAFTQTLTGSLLFILFGAVLGLAVWGLLPDPRRQWPWMAGISFLLGLAVLLGLIEPAERVILRVAPLLLLLGVVCQVYGLGRLLRILQDQIGLRWRTTLVVAAATAAVYFGEHFISGLG